MAEGLEISTRKKKTTEAQQRAHDNYIRDHDLCEIKFRVTKTRRDEIRNYIKEHTDSNGEPIYKSVNDLITKLLEAEIPSKDSRQD